MPEYDASKLTPEQQYKLMTSTVVPRPIALVTTLGPEGPNAAPFSFFNMVASDPPAIMFSAGPRGKSMKDTIRNIELLPEFVVHIVDEPNKEKMNICSTEWEYGVNEIERSGFRTAPSRMVKPPRLIDCPVQYECRLIQFVKIGNKPYTMVIGEIVNFHLRDGLVDEQKMYVNTPAIQAMGRMEGRDMYCRSANDRFSMPRPDLPKK